MLDKGGAKILYSTHLTNEQETPKCKLARLEREIELLKLRISQHEHDADRPDLKHLKDTFGMFFYSPFFERPVW